MCTPLWIACADTPLTLCAAWGHRWGHPRLPAAAGPSACCYAIHRLCGRKTFAAFWSSTTARSYPHTEDDRSPPVSGQATGRRGALRRSRAGSRFSASACEPAGRRAIVRVCVRPPKRRWRSWPGPSTSWPRTVSAGAAPGQLAERIDRLWGMIADLDPELARRRSGTSARRTARPTRKRPAAEGAAGAVHGSTRTPDLPPACPPAPPGRALERRALTQRCTAGRVRRRRSRRRPRR